MWGSLRFVVACAGARLVCQKSLMMSWVVCVGGGGAGEGESVMTAIVMVFDDAVGKVDDAVDI